MQIREHRFDSGRRLHFRNGPTPCAILRFPTPSGRRARIAALALAAVAPTSCIPAHDVFLRVPVVVGDQHPGGPILVRVPLERLWELLPEFDPDTAALYYRGRTPLPFRVVIHDEDGGGDGGDPRPDRIEVVLPDDRPPYWIVFVCPGRRPPADFPFQPGGSALGVEPDFAKARR